jgi:hypothetical protein
VLAAIAHPSPLIRSRMRPSALLEPFSSRPILKGVGLTQLNCPLSFIRHHVDTTLFSPAISLGSAMGRTTVAIPISFGLIFRGFKLTSFKCPFFHSN